jgi:hypothetical protein
MTIIMTLPVASSGAVAGWTITAVLTLLLIGMPLFYLLALTFAIDEEAFDRNVRDQVRYVELKARADAYAYGKDIYGVLAPSPESASAPAAAAPQPAPTDAASTSRQTLGPRRDRGDVAYEPGPGTRRAPGRGVGRLPRA